MGKPVAEFDLTEGLVRLLLAEQHPDLADLALRHLDSGWDNDLWRLGPDLLVRLPRRKSAAALALQERRWLPHLAPDLPLPVPVPVRCGEPCAEYPWPWSIVRWIEGLSGDRARLRDPGATAASLGCFLRALHRPAPPDAPRNITGRGGPLSERASTFGAAIDAVGSSVDAGVAWSIWTAALRAPVRERAPVWLHGDLHPANLVFQEGDLAGVLDFGDLCAGDPATDLGGMWMLVPPAWHHGFFAAYGDIDAGEAARARGWALLFGVLFTGLGLGGIHRYGRIGRRTLGWLMATHHEA